MLAARRPGSVADHASDAACVRNSAVIRFADDTRRRPDDTSNHSPKHDRMRGKLRHDACGRRQPQGR